MEEPVAENGGSQQPPPPNTNVGRSDWMDLGGFSALICELQATVTLAEQWIIIQHARFDFSVESEPYHASQVLVNQESKEFIVRVWGKTFRKGTVSSIADLQDICKSALGSGAASCPGHYSDSLGHLFEHMPSFTQLTHPFKRWVSRGCQVLYEKRDSSESRVKICTSCSSIKEEPTDGVSSDHSHRPNKMESLGQLDFRKRTSVKEEDEDDDQMNPEDYLEVGYHDDPEKMIRLSENQYDKKKIKKQAKKVAKAGKTQCEMCGEEFLLSHQMRAHLIQQHQWGIFTCHICLYVLFHPDELSNHLMEIHKDEEGGNRAQCPHCKEDITLVEDNMSALADHYKACVLTERPKPGEKVKEKIVCETCGKEVTCRSQLKIHMMKHTGETPFKCLVPGCGKGFPTKNNLKKHEEMHDRHLKGLPMPKNFICDLCGNTFLCRANLREHIALKHEKKSMNIKCTECHLVFVHRREMYRHKYSVHFTDKYKCKVCGKHFGISTQLKKHMAVHEPEGRFECELCGARLKGKSSMTEHMRVHRGEKPFKCPYCDYRGTSSSLLIHHKRGRHKAELEMEMLEKERQSIKVPLDVQKRAAEEAGIPIGVEEMMQHSVGSSSDHDHSAHMLDIKPQMPHLPPHPGMPHPGMP